MFKLRFKLLIFWALRYNLHLFYHVDKRNQSLILFQPMETLSSWWASASQIKMVTTPLQQSRRSLSEDSTHRDDSPTSNEERAQSRQNMVSMLEENKHCSTSMLSYTASMNDTNELTNPRWVQYSCVYSIEKILNRYYVVIVTLWCINHHQELWGHWFWSLHILVV